MIFLDTVRTEPTRLKTETNERSLRPPQWLPTGTMARSVRDAKPLSPLSFRIAGWMMRP
jgi:hypothetical protein